MSCKCTCGLLAGIRETETAMFRSPLPYAFDSFLSLCDCKYTEVLLDNSIDNMQWPS